jgi:UDP-2,3-diacylglucosamine hydrolase
MWMRDYFQKELNIPVYFAPAYFEFSGRRFLIGHGDGLGPGDKGYKAIKKLFRHPVSKWLFGALPPYIGIGLADYLSRKSRAKTGKTDEVFLGEDKEWLVLYAKEMLKQEHVDYFIFGHRHLPLDVQLSANSRYINLGDWIKYFSYAEFDGVSISLKYYS